MAMDDDKVCNCLLCDCCIVFGRNSWSYFSISKPLPPSHFRQVFNSCPLQALFFKKAIEDMAACSLRCIAIAYRSYEIDKVPVGEQELSQWELPEDDLVLLAIIGLKV